MCVYNHDFLGFTEGLGEGRFLDYLCINQLLNSPCFKINVMHPTVFIFLQEVKPFPPTRIFINLG